MEPNVCLRDPKGWWQISRGPKKNRNLLWDLRIVANESKCKHSLSQWSFWVSYQHMKRNTHAWWWCVKSYCYYYYWCFFCPIWKQINHLAAVVFFTEKKRDMYTHSGSMKLKLIKLSVPKKRKCEKRIHYWWRIGFQNSKL